jgi:protein-S-isoprenylcysteine O-methyltransferase Ste14
MHKVNMSTAQLGQQTNDSGPVRGIVRPPLLLLAAVLLGFGLDHIVPLPRSIPGLAHWITAAIASSLVLLGIAVFAAGIRDFARAATPVHGTKPPRSLVTTGIYRRSRNPIYLGMLLVCVGVGLAVRSPWILLFAVPLAITLRYRIIAREEAYLEQRFGDAYRDYKTRVHRWL